MTWTAVSLGDLTASTRPICYGVLKPGPHVADGVPLLRIVDMAGDVVAADGYHRISRELDSEFVRSRLRGGEVLLSIQGTVGRVAIAPESLAGANISRTIAVIEPDSRIEARFLRLYLMYRTATSGYDTTGSTRASLNISTIRDMRIPVPCIEEQCRIVAILEDHLSRLDATVSYIASAVRRIEAWRSAAVQMELWKADPDMRPVGELLREGMRNGRSDRAVKGSETGTKTLTLTAVTRNQFTDEFTKMTVTPPETATGLWLERGDILVQRSNTPDLVGTAARYDGPANWAIFPDLLIRLRPDESAVDGRFLVAALRSEKVHRTLRARAKGLAGSMPKIDQRAIAETLVPVPSLARQLEAVRRIAEIEASAKAAVAQVSRQGQRSGTLRKSLLAAAFSGHLTGTTGDPGRSEDMVGA